jgi:hypothetical protein
VATQSASAPAQNIALPVAEPKPAPATVAAVEPPKVAATTPAANDTGAVHFTLPLAAPPSVATVQPAPTLPVGEAAKSTERPKASVHMVTIIENLRVAGIRAAGDDSKVLMNDRVYRLNDIIDHDLGIRLTGVTAQSLTFADDSGAVYTRNF